MMKTKTKLKRSTPSSSNLHFFISNIWALWGSIYFPEQNGTAGTELPERPEHVCWSTADLKQLVVFIIYTTCTIAGYCIGYSLLTFDYYIIIMKTQYVLTQQFHNDSMRSRLQGQGLKAKAKATTPRPRPQPSRPRPTFCGLRPRPRPRPRPNITAIY